MNEQENTQMRLEILDREEKRSLGAVRYYAKHLRKMMSRVLCQETDDRNDHVRLLSLDELCAYCSLEEMAELLEERYQRKQELMGDHVIRCVDYNIDSKGKIITCITEIPQFPKSWFS